MKLEIQICFHLQRLHYLFLNEKSQQNPVLNCHVQFVLNNDDFIGHLDITSDLIEVKISDFKPESKIKQIRIL